EGHGRGSAGRSAPGNGVSRRGQVTLLVGAAGTGVASGAWIRRIHGDGVRRVHASGRNGAIDRVRECGQLDPGAREWTPEGNGDAHGFGRKPLAHGAATADGEHGTRASR